MSPVASPKHSTLFTLDIEIPKAVGCVIDTFTVVLQLLESVTRIA